MAFERILERTLDSHVVEALVKHELNRILQTCQPQKVFLFGSAARNEATDASDLDFLVILNDQDDLKSIKKLYYRNPLKKMIPVDAIFVRESDFVARSQIGGICMMCADEGKVIFNSTKR